MSASGPAATADAIDWAGVRRVLVIRLRSIGDAVLSTPSLIALKRFLPNAEIDILLEDGEGAGRRVVAGQAGGDAGRADQRAAAEDIGDLKRDADDDLDRAGGARFGMPDIVAGLEEGGGRIKPLLQLRTLDGLAQHLLSLHPRLLDTDGLQEIDWLRLCRERRAEQNGGDSRPPHDRNDRPNH